MSQTDVAVQNDLWVTTAVSLAKLTSDAIISWCSSWRVLTTDVGEGARQERRCHLHDPEFFKHMSAIYIYIYIFCMAEQPQVGQGLLIIEASRSQT